MKVYIGDLAYKAMFLSVSNLELLKIREAILFAIHPEQMRLPPITQYR